MQLIAHGGAGGEPDEPDERQAVLDDAVAQGSEQATPMDAAVVTTRRLEESPRFNAGTGSAVQSDGRIRTDAGVMHSDGRTGAACSMPAVEYAADVARLVAEETPHILLAGDHAVSFGAAYDIPTGIDLWSERNRTRWEELETRTDGSVKDQLEWVHEQFGGTDTVGAVATDGEELAAVTSTGGRWAALAGRVGDVPQVGAGFYASEHAAASATGAGEAIARFGVARKVVEAVEDGSEPETATTAVIEAFGEATGEQAGVIGIDTAGNTGSAFNSDGMQTGRNG